MVTIPKEDFKISITYHYALLKIIDEMIAKTNRFSKNRKELVKQKTELVKFIEKYEDEALS